MSVSFVFARLRSGRGNPALAGLAMLFLTCLCLAMGYFLQYSKGYLPCPLCIMQRLAMFCIGCTTLLGLIFSSFMRRFFYWSAQILWISAGLFFALRQLWLQAQPPGSITACMPELDILIQYFPLSDVLRALFWGAGECVKAHYQWLGLSLATWSLFYFISAALLLLMMYDASRNR